MSQPSARTERNDRAPSVRIAHDGSVRLRARQLAQCASAVHTSNPATTYSVVHCLGHCAWTLFHGLLFKKKKKKRPSGFRVSHFKEKPRFLLTKALSGAFLLGM